MALSPSWFHGWKARPLGSPAVTHEFVPFLLSYFPDSSTVLLGFSVFDFNSEARKPEMNQEIRKTGKLVGVRRWKLGVRRWKIGDGFVTFLVSWLERPLYVARRCVRAEHTAPLRSRSDYRNLPRGSALPLPGPRLRVTASRCDLAVRPSSGLPSSTSHSPDHRVLCGAYQQSFYSVPLSPAPCLMRVVSRCDWPAG